MPWGVDTWGVHIWGHIEGVVKPVEQLSPGEAERRRQLGEDIAFRKNTIENSTGDYALQSGVPALRNAILRRLLTAPGEFAARPTYGVGIRRFVKERKTTALLSTIRNRIVDQLSFEPRIERIVNVGVESGVDTLKITVAVQTNSELLTFEPFDFNENGVS